MHIHLRPRVIQRIWEFGWYELALVIVLATIVNIFLERESIHTYYSEMNQPSQQSSFSSVLEGQGTVDFPYLISSEADLLEIRDGVQQGLSTSGVYFKLTADIDLVMVSEWKAIGTTEHPLNGIFDGNGHTVRNLTITGENNSIFGIVDNCRIQNFLFEDITIQGNHNAVLVNYSVGEGSFFIVNCLATNVVQKSNPSTTQDDVAVFANNLTRGRIIHCYASNISDQMTIVGQASDGDAIIRDCLFLNVDVAKNTTGIEEIRNSSLLEQNQVTLNDECLNALTNYGLNGTFLEWEQDDLGNITFSNEKIKLYSEKHMSQWYRFVRYMLLHFCVIVVISLLGRWISIRYNLSVSKCIFYGLMGYCLIFMLIAGFQSNGGAIIYSLYDGRQNERLKIFTDFFDCVLPGVDPYTKTVTPYRSIYPPFISFVFYLLSGFIPQSELSDAITARDSQMGSVIFLIFSALLVVLMYSLIQKYKGGKNAEKVWFFVLMCASFPFIYCMERGNIVLLAALLLITFFYNYNSSHYWKRQIAYLALSVVVGIKIYPVVLGFLLLKRGSVKDVINCLSYGVVVNLLPSIVFPTRFASIVYMIIIATHHMAGTMFVGGKMDLPHLLLMPSILFQWSGGMQTLIYRSIVIIGSLLTVVVVWFGNMQEWKKGTLIILDYLLFASFSPSYYSLYFIAPLMMFLDSKSARRGMINIIYSLLFIGIFALFICQDRYPLQAFFPSQGIAYTTLIHGFSWITFECVLLIDGLISCRKKLAAAKKVTS